MMRLKEMKVADGLGYSNHYRDPLILGQKLADLPMSQGGWKEMFSNTKDIDEVARIPGYTNKPEEIVAMTSLLLENEKLNLLSMNEDVRAITVGGFQDMLFPIIRAAIPSNPILDLVTVWTLTRRHGQVFFFNYVVGQTKGRYTKGSRFFDAQAGYIGGHNYSDEFVDGEILVAASGAGNTSLSGTCAYAGNGSGGVRPQSVVIRAIQNNGGAETVLADNGNGVIVAVSDPGSEFTSGTINYSTGAVALTFGTAPSSTGDVTISYEYDSEGSSNLPTLDIQLVSSPVTAQRRALRMRYTTEALQDYQAEFGRSIDEDMAEGIAAGLITETAREVISDLWKMAGNPIASFDTAYNPTTFNFAKSEAWGDIKIPLHQVINKPLLDTQRVRMNACVIDVAMLNVLNALGPPYFYAYDRAPIDDDKLGVKFVGVLDNRVRVYCDPLLHTLPGASPNGNGLFLYKGPDRMENVAYIYAMYRAMYTTPAITLDDFVTRKAFATRIARKPVNSRLVKRFEITRSY